MDSPAIGEGDSPAIGEGSPAVSTDAASAPEEVAEAPPMTEQERARMERLQEIERLRAKEKFVTAPTGGCLSISVCPQHFAARKGAEEST